MKFSSKIKVEAAASKDDSRLALTYVHYNRAAHCLEACDGFILLLLPVTDDGQDEDALVPVAAIAAARKAAKKYDDCEIFCQNGRVGCKGEFWETGKEAYPDVQQVLPNVEGKPPFFAIDLARLRRLAEAFGGKDAGATVKLKRAKVDSAVRVDCLNGSGAVGVIMSAFSAKDRVLDDGLEEAPKPAAPKRVRAKKAK